MTYEQLMHKALNDMLKEGETLYHPVYGCVMNGGVIRYAYFGFTDGCFLIAYISNFGKKITGNVRIPLKIESVVERDSRFLGQRTVDISFQNGESYKIRISPKVMVIKNQGEVFPRFFDYLASKTPSFVNNDLKKTEGTVIRKQFLFGLTVTLLSFAPLILLLMIMLDVTDYGETEMLLSEHIALVISICILIGGPLGLLSFVHRMTGKVICVINRNGIHLKGRTISFKEITDITYSPDTGSRRRLPNSILHVTVKRADGRKHTSMIEHFPLRGLRAIRNNAPDLRIKWDKRAVGDLVFCALMPAVMGIIFFVYGLIKL